MSRVSHHVMTPLTIRHHCGCTSSAKRRMLQVRAQGLFVFIECDNFLIVPCCQRVEQSHESVGKNFELHRDLLVSSLLCVSAVFSLAL